jgi:RHS repeat-associated protein
MRQIEISNKFEKIRDKKSIPHAFDWDANGNMTKHDMRLRYWDEENRMMSIRTGNTFGYYMYDANGERSYKLNGYITQYNLNGQISYYPYFSMATLYVSPYLVATSQGYTKHYYAGTERVASKIGGGGITDINSSIGDANSKWTNSQYAYSTFWNSCVDPRPVCTACTSYIYHMHYYNNVLAPETDIYFYHPDHLGSASWITDSAGKPIQHLQYMPFGERFVDQQVTGSNWSTRYTFSGKEKDEESNYSYFGARYYDSDISIWLGVDPMASKYPSLTPYNYCANNPMKLVDPNGEDIVITGAAADEATSQLQNKTNLKLTRDAETGKLSYEGKAKSSADRMLKKAIDNQNITVNVVADNSDNFTAHDGKTHNYAADDNGLIGGGAYGGSTVSDNGHVNSYQYVNPQRMSAMDKLVGDATSGGYMLHEVAEGFYSGKMAFSTKIGDGVLNGPRYEAAHQQANKISGGGWIKEDYYKSGINYKTGQRFQYFDKTIYTRNP